MNNRRKFISTLPAFVIGMIAGNVGAEEVLRSGEPNAVDSLKTKFLVKDGTEEDTASHFSALISTGDTQILPDRITTNQLILVPYTHNNPADVLSALENNGCAIWKPTSPISVNLDLYFETPNADNLKERINARGCVFIQRAGEKLRSIDLRNISEFTDEEKISGLLTIRLNGETLLGAKCVDIWS